MYVRIRGFPACTVDHTRKHTRRSRGFLSRKRSYELHTKKDVHATYARPVAETKTGKPLAPDVHAAFRCFVPDRQRFSDGRTRRFRAPGSRRFRPHKTHAAPNRAKQAWEPPPTRRLDVADGVTHRGDENLPAATCTRPCVYSSISKRKIPSWRALMLQVSGIYCWTTRV